MGSQKQETTQTVTLPGMGDTERQARSLLSSLSSSGMDQLGNLSELAKGNVNLSPQMSALIEEINRRSMEQARAEARRNYEDMSSTVMDSSLEAGISGSSADAVNRAILGRQLQGTLDATTRQGQINSAEQMRQSAFDSAGVQLNANQLLLQRILQGAGSLAEMGLQERLAQPTTTTTQKTGGMSWNSLAQLGGRGIAALASGGTSELANAAASGGTEVTDMAMG